MNTASPGPADARILDWDSAHFGFPIGRLPDGPLNTDPWSRARAWAESAGIRCLYWFCDADEATVAEAGARGFRLADVRLTFAGRAGDLAGSPRPDAAFPCRTATADDLPVLQELAGEAHQNTRFWRDPGFPRPACRALYRTWMEAAVRGAAWRVLVLEHGQQVGGYVTIERTPHSMRIGLVAVDATLRGRGAGSALIRAAATAVCDHNADLPLEATTQSDGPALRFYARMGLTLQRVGLCWHWWAPASA